MKKLNKKNDEKKYENERDVSNANNNDLFVPHPNSIFKAKSHFIVTGDDNMSQQRFRKLDK